MGIKYVFFRLALMILTRIPWKHSSWHLWCLMRHFLDYSSSHLNHIVEHLHLGCPNEFSENFPGSTRKFPGWVPFEKLRFFPVQPRIFCLKSSVFPGLTENFPGGSGWKAPVFPGWTGKYAGGSGRFRAVSPLLYGSGWTGEPIHVGHWIYIRFNFAILLHYPYSEKSYSEKYF